MKRKKKAVYYTKRPKNIPNHEVDEDEEEGSVLNQDLDFPNHGRDVEKEEGTVSHEKHRMTFGVKELAKRKSVTYFYTI